MLRTMLSVFIVLVTVGCGGPRYVDYFPYHDDGTPKPRVALMMMVNSTDCGLPWDVTEELSQGLYYDLMHSGKLYVLSPEEIGPMWAKQKSIDFFSDDMNFTSELCNVDFIVALELIEHSVIPYDPCLVASKSFPQCSSVNRTIALRTRVKVIDVRRECPSIFLYEIVKSSYNVTATNDNINYNLMDWRNESFPLTPCGRLHQRMVRDLTLRLEEEIGYAK